MDGKVLRWRTAEEVATFHSSGWWSYLTYDKEQPTPKLDRALLGRVVAYGKPYMKLGLVVIITVIGITVMSLFPPLLMRDLLDHAIPNRDLSRVTWLGLAMVAVPLANGMLGVAQRWATARAGEGIIFDLRRQLYSHLQGMSLRFFTATRTGEIMSRLNNDVVGAHQAVTGTVVSLVSNLLAVSLTLVIMLGLEWRLTLLAVAVLPLFILPSRRVGRMLRQVATKQMDVNAQMNTTMNETLGISGALLVKLFGRGKNEHARFSQQAAQVRDLGIRRALIGRWFFLALGLVSSIGVALVFWVGANLAINENLTVGTIVALSAYLTQLYGPLADLSNTRVEFVTSLVSFERVFEVLDLEQEIRETENPIRLERVEGAVAFEDVWFRYDGGERLASVKRPSFWRPPDHVDEDLDQLTPPRSWALCELTFRVDRGELVALVGPSGAGKTTATYLLPRLYDPTQGRVTVDGYDVRTLSLETLARAIGVVTQDTHLFHDTIAANLLYAKPEANLGDLEAACRVANIHEFIASLPKGYQTLVGERGYRLSGGEKQRLAIARVVLKNPRILILDEATSHLDARSEALIQEALDRVMEGRTSLVIAHRLSTILAADRILVLDEGRLIESGTHSQLVAAGGLYARLYETQFRQLDAQASSS